MKDKERRKLAKKIIKSKVISELLTGKAGLIRTNEEKKTDYYQAYNRLLDNVEQWIEEEIK